MHIPFKLKPISLLIGFLIFTFSCHHKSEINNNVQEEAIEIFDNTPSVALNGSLEQLDSSSHIRTIRLPAQLSFAGESVPLHIPDVRERLERELYVNTFWHSNTILLLKRVNRWKPRISEILKQNNIPRDFVYLCIIESGLKNVVSPSNAVGFWQILKPTGKELGLEINREVDERYDPIKSTYAAVKYLKKAYSKFGSWTTVAAAYNRGIRGMSTAMDDQMVSSYYDLNLNEETSRYLFRILAAKELINRPEAYGFSIPKEELYFPEETFQLKINKSIKNLPAFAKSKGINYKLLKRFNPWLRSYKLSVSGKKEYYFLLPVIKK